MNHLASIIGSVIISAKYKKMLYGLEPSIVCDTSLSFPLGPVCVVVYYTVLRVMGQCLLQGCWLLCLLIWPTLISFLITLDEFWLWYRCFIFGHCGCNSDTPCTSSPQSCFSCVLTSLLVLSLPSLLSKINLGVWFGVSKLTFILPGSLILPLYPGLYSAYWEGKIFLLSAKLHV